MIFTIRCAYCMVFQKKLATLKYTLTDIVSVIKQSLLAILESHLKAVICNLNVLSAVQNYRDVSQLCAI